MLLDLLIQLQGCHLANGKHCSRCGETKPQDEFAASNRYADGGLQRWCKACMRRANKEWYWTIGKQRREAAGK